jgi:hypothetical protein
MAILKPSSAATPVGTHMRASERLPNVWPGFGEDARSVINDRIGEYDIFIGVFWNRFGTPTAGQAKKYDSGPE